MNFIPFYIAFHDPIWVAVLSTALFFPVRNWSGFCMLEKNKKLKTQFRMMKK